MSIAPEHLDREKEDLDPCISSSTAHVVRDKHDTGWMAHSHNVATLSDHSSKRCSLELDYQQSTPITESTLTSGSQMISSLGFTNTWLRSAPPLIAKRPQLMMVLACRVPGVIDTAFHDQWNSTQDISHLPYFRYEKASF